MASESTEYFKKNPKAAENKRRIQRKINKSKKAKKYRAFLNRKNREAGTYGNGDGLDYDHTEGKFMSAKRNRSKDKPKKKKK